MNFLMLQKLCILTKVFPMLVTHIGFVALVTHQVHKARTLLETFLILLHSRFSLDMNNPVLDKIVTLAKALPTFTTFIWFLPSLDIILLALV